MNDEIGVDVIASGRMSDSEPTVYFEEESCDGMGSSISCLVMQQVSRTQRKKYGFCYAQSGIQNTLTPYHN